MATTVAMHVAGKIEKVLEKEAALLAGVEDDARYMVRELRSMTTFLAAMSIRPNLNDQLQIWVAEVREVAYDAEDSIDEFEYHLRSTADKGFLMRGYRCLKSLKARHVVASELKKLKIQIEEIRKRHERYYRPNEATSSGTATSLFMADKYSDPRIIGHFVEEAQLVGINQSRDTLIKWVMDETYPDLTTISLVGFGGLGKTTLAKTVYDDSVVVGGHFQSRAWIAVSQNYSIRELLKKIIRQISVPEQQIRDVLGCQDDKLNTEQLLNMMEESQLVHTIRGHLQGKRYLLVFDDVWRTEAWKSLSIALPSGKEGSKVIVTTRSEDVANSSCSGNRQFIFKVSPLSPELSWELFCKKVFEAPDYSCPPELENVGREILQKCSGLPLAIVTIGGLLAYKKPEEWKDLRDHLRSEIQTNDMLSNINQILGLSYNDLPYHLKPCFLFLGTFPEDYEIRRKHLMRRWIGEGIVSGVDDFPAEKVAERCFNELVSRSLVQPSEFDDIGTVKSCRVHDMILEVIISISRKENFVVLLNEHPPQHQKIRRLSCHGGSSGVLIRSDSGTDLSHLRSFSSFDEDVPLNDYRKQRLLRAIHREGFQDYLRLHPKCFSKLRLLKYLSLRNNTRLSELPDSIGDLQNLEFLDIRGTNIQELPKAIVKLKKLVYLFGGVPVFVRHTLKDDMRVVSSLKLPKGIGKLKNLRTFGTADADNMQLLQEIGGLVELQKLAINFGDDDRVSEVLKGVDTLLSKLSGSLRSLTIFFWGNDNLKEALDTVASPPLLLRKLHIYGRLGKLPPWFAHLNQVVKITLLETDLQLEDVQVLRNLHTLVKLVLAVNSFVNPKKALVFDRGGFTHLKFLNIYSQSVSFEEGTLQSLEILKIYILSFKCSVDGIEHLQGLKEVHIHTQFEDTMELVKRSTAIHSNRPKYFATIINPDD